jgi:hypothetical protein
MLSRIGLAVAAALASVGVSAAQAPPPRTEPWTYPACPASVAAVARGPVAAPVHVPIGYRVLVVPGWGRVIYLLPQDYCPPRAWQPGDPNPTLTHTNE